MASEEAVVDPWQEFCERLKRAGRVLAKPGLPPDELTRAEGYRHLARLVHMGWMAGFELADPERPQMVRAVSRHMLGEGETSDARYEHAFIDGTSTYRVRGRRGASGRSPCRCFRPSPSSCWWLTSSMPSSRLSA